MPKHALGSDARRERVVVEHVAGKTRYVLDVPTHRALVTVADAELLETPLAVRALTRRPEPAKASGEPVLVAPGLPLERRAEHKGYTRVRVDRDNLAAEGWLASADIGPVYVPADVPAGARGTTWVLAPRTNVLARPGGAVVASLGEATLPRVIAVELNRTASWFVEIEIRMRKLSVRGFVPKNALTAESGNGYGSGFGRIARKPAEPVEQVVFPAGACLYAEPWGEVIGVLRTPLSAKVHVEEGERVPWRELDLGELARAWVPRSGAMEQAPDPLPAPLLLASGFSCSLEPEKAGADGRR